MYYWNEKGKKDYNESHVTRGAISPGTQLCQTWNSQLDLEVPAKKWATKLPRRFTGEKLQKKRNHQLVQKNGNCFLFFVGPFKI